MDLTQALQKFLTELDEDTIPPAEFGVELNLTADQGVYLACAIAAFLNRHWYIESKYDYR